MVHLAGQESCDARVNAVTGGSTAEAVRSAELAESNRALEAGINERIQAQEALEQQNATLREQSHLLDLVNDAIFIRRLDDTISYWNEGAERLYGWTSAEAVGRSTHEVLRTEFPVESVRSISAA